MYDFFLNFQIIWGAMAMSMVKRYLSKPKKAFGVNHIVFLSSIFNGPLEQQNGDFIHSKNIEFPIFFWPYTC